MTVPSIDVVAAVIFAIAIAHTFSTQLFERLAHRHPRHAGLLHLLGEVEIVFGVWAVVLLVAMALLSGGKASIDYAESRSYTEPLFVFVIMVVAASRPVLVTIEATVLWLAHGLPVRTVVAQVWLCLALVPLAGSIVTEPGAMTIAALLLAPLVFRAGMPEPLKYAALGVLFVNVSIGGTLSAFAAPPVLMVVDTWNWTSLFMLETFGWRVAIAAAVNASVVTWLLRKHLVEAVPAPAPTDERPNVPLVVRAIHFAALIGVVLFAHHPVFFIGVFLLFMGYTQAYERYQDSLVLKPALLVAFFLAGLVVLGGLQHWWLQPLVSSLEPIALFFAAVGLTAITDNAALTYLGSLITGLDAHTRYLLVAGAVAGGGLTVIANAPNPAGVALLKDGFIDESIGAIGLLMGALPPTVVAVALLLV